MDSITRNNTSEALEISHVQPQLEAEVTMPMFDTIGCDIYRAARLDVHLRYAYTVGDVAMRQLEVDIPISSIPSGHPSSILPSTRI